MLRPIMTPYIEHVEVKGPTRQQQFQGLERTHYLIYPQFISPRFVQKDTRTDMTLADINRLVDGHWQQLKLANWLITAYQYLTQQKPILAQLL